MEYLATFLEGVVTFASPCLLPMLPLFIAYFAGDANAAAAKGHNGFRTGRTVANAIGFVCGFTLVFVALGLLAGAFGQLLVSYSSVLNVVCGVIVIVFGLHYAGVFEIPLLSRTLKPNANVVPRTFASAVLFGVVFAVGWTPCVGVFLGSALAMAAVASSAAKGCLLLLCYSLGLSIPFLISAVAIDQIAGALDVVKRHYRLINAVCGILLVVMGILMATGMLDSLLRGFLS